MRILILGTLCAGRLSAIDVMSTVKRFAEGHAKDVLDTLENCARFNNVTEIYEGDCFGIKGNLTNKKPTAESSSFIQTLQMEKSERLLQMRRTIYYREKAHTRYSVNLKDVKTSKTAGISLDRAEFKSAAKQRTRMKFSVNIDEGVLDTFPWYGKLNGKLLYGNMPAKTPKLKGRRFMSPGITLDGKLTSGSSIYRKILFTSDELKTESHDELEKCLMIQAGCNMSGILRVKSKKGREGKTNVPKYALKFVVQKAKPDGSDTQNLLLFEFTDVSDSKSLGTSSLTVEQLRKPLVLGDINHIAVYYKMTVTLDAAVSTKLISALDELFPGLWKEKTEWLGYTSSSEASTSHSVIVPHPVEVIKDLYSYISKEAQPYLNLIIKGGDALLPNATLGMHSVYLAAHYDKLKPYVDNSIKNARCVEVIKSVGIDFVNFGSKLAIQDNAPKYCTIFTDGALSVNDVVYKYWKVVTDWLKTNVVNKSEDAGITSLKKRILNSTAKWNEDAKRMRKDDMWIWQPVSIPSS